MTIKPKLELNAHLDQIFGIVDLGELGKSTQPATHALVLMIRGLFSKWKHIIAYYFIRNTVARDILCQIIIRASEIIHNAGFKIIGVVFDQEPNQMSFLRNNGISANNSKLILDKTELSVILDPPHLLKNTRNNLMNYNIKFGQDQKTAKWQHLLMLFREENANSLKLEPRLTAAHLMLNSFSKMRVNYAAQLFSRSVSVAIRKYVLLEKLPNEALETADFIEEINNLFDMLNTQRINATGYHEPITKFNFEEKIKILENYHSWTSTWKFEK